MRQRDKGLRERKRQRKRQNTTVYLEADRGTRLRQGRRSKAKRDGIRRDSKVAIEEAMQEIPPSADKEGGEPKRKALTRL